MIKESEYKKRRQKLSKKLHNNSLGIVFSSPLKVRSNDTHYPYRQNSNFYYLCGFREDNSALVFSKTKDEFKTILFVQKKEPSLELWDGKRLGVEASKQMFDVDEVYAYGEFNQKIKELLLDKNSLYTEFDIGDERIASVLGMAKNIYTHHNISHKIQKLRLIKSKSEITLIKKAIKITKKAHHDAIKFAKVGKYEYELQANIEYTFKKYGAYSDAYTTIVASGNNANTLHYIKNTKKMKEGELVLIDAGCEYEYYASDITRTIPVNGVFSKAQKELYSLVLDTQLKIISMIKPDAKRSALQEEAEILLVKGLKKLGILRGKTKEIIEQKKHKKYYPHGIGHWMGLDVHDMAPYRYKNKDEIALKNRMVLTIEPGIYIDKKDKSVPKKYRGIGVRIEDNILVTKEGYKNLSAKIAKSIDEIESLAR